MPEFVVGLKPGAGVDLSIEGPGSIAAQDLQDFYTKFLRYFDRLERLKFIHHVRFHAKGLSSEEQKRFSIYEALGRKALRDLKEQLGDSNDSLMGLRNVMGNLPRILNSSYPDQIQVQQPFHAVVVSAGPSLDLEIDRLKSIQNKALIIAVDAVLRTLLESGIEPHLVCCTERGEETLPFFKDLPTGLKTTLVGQGTVSPKVFEIYPGSKMTSFKFSSHFLWLPLEAKKYWIGGSVAHLCYRLAAELGAKSIALVGQDLAYHPETLQTHGRVLAYPGWSEGDTFENRKVENLAHWVKGNTLARVPTNPLWGLFADEYSELVADAQVPTFNTSKLGRAIARIPYMSFEDWCLRLENQVEIRLPDSKRFSEHDQKAVALKLKDAIHKLSALRVFLKRPHDSKKVYECLLNYPHFLELVLEVMIHSYVEAENLRWKASEDVQREAERVFLNRLGDRLEPILEVLHDAEGQMMRCS